MTDEPFLARWSRRKREAERDPAAPAHGHAPSARPRESGDPEFHDEKTQEATLDSRWSLPPTAIGGGNERVENAQPDQEHQADLSQLPSLDSITSTTDIRAFLARGVPAALSREALRRAWAADPTIRDFVGPAENAWDFTAPNGVPGFGPMLPPNPVVAASDAVRPFVRDLDVAAPARGPAPDSKGATAEASTTPDAGAREQDAPPESDSHTLVTKGRSSDERRAPDVETPTDRLAGKQNQDVAPQEASNGGEPGMITARRRHGGALPS